MIRVKKILQSINFSQILMIWLMWRLGLVFLAYIAPNVLPFQVTFSNYAVQNQASLPIWLEKWFNFDGGAYILIARDGYRAAALLEAYFPLFPLVYRGLTFCLAKLLPGLISANLWLISGYLLNVGLSLLMLILAKKFFQELLGEKMASKALIAVVLFPTSFFYQAIYTESLFMALL